MSRIESLQVQRYEATDAAPAVIALRRDESVWLRDGNRLFGAVSADARGVRVSGVYEVALPWSDVCGITIGGAPPLGTPVRGVIAQIGLQPLADHFPHDGDLLMPAVVSSDAEHLEIAHPLLGMLRLPAAHVRRIEPRYAGTRTVLSAGKHHLGDEFRTEFWSPEPYGTALDGEFTLDTLPDGSAFFAVEAAELEPCGPGTPRGSPFLRTLREGQLTTAVFMNGIPIGTLNEAIRFRDRAGQPRRIRLSIEPGVLNPGPNTWRLEQRPSRGNRRLFDDCEVGPIALEIEQPGITRSE